MANKSTQEPEFNKLKLEHANNNGAGRAALTMASRAGVAPAHLHLETSAAIVGSSTPVEIKSTPSKP